MNHISELLKKMKENCIDYYIVGICDSHCSEYVGEHDKTVLWLTGFTGSNATLVVSKEESLLWTDGRYYIQCEKELMGTGIKMMKMGEPDSVSVSDYLVRKINDSAKKVKLGFIGTCTAYKDIERIIENVERNKLEIYADDIIDDIWTDRPPVSTKELLIQDAEYIGKSMEEKLEQVRQLMERFDCKQLLINSLDDIMWLLNVRGNDIAFNPVALSYAFVTMDEIYFFISPESLSNKARICLNNMRVVTCEYNDIVDFLSEYPYDGKTMMDTSKITYSLAKAVEVGYADKYCKDVVVDRINPTTELKAVKDETEIKWMKKFFLDDSVAMVKYIYWLKNQAFMNGELNEIVAADKCDELRKAVPGCMGLSFPTIAAYGANAAMMHYEATDADYSVCMQNGMILTDCGGQYPGATTDVTRTVALGPVSDEEREHYTLVLKGFLALMNAVFIKGCTGRNLDILAREPLWKKGIDYKCGTGHGVGYCLNVHEGPHAIRYKYIEGRTETVLKSGMVVTCEPGVYVEGKYGIRTENTLLIKESNMSDEYLEFESLTWVPLDNELIDYDMLDKTEIKMLNEYNKQLLEQMEGRLNKNEYDWLKNVCKEVV